jgi:hypothetical protein
VNKFQFGRGTHLSVSLSAPGPPVSTPSPRGCHALRPRHKSVGRQRCCPNATTTSRLTSRAADRRCSKPTAPPSRQPHRRLTAIPTVRSKAAARLWSGRRRRRLLPISHCAVAFTAPPAAALVPFRLRAPVRPHRAIRVPPSTPRARPHRR